MKKALSFVLALFMMLSLVACGDEPEAENPQSPETETKDETNGEKTVSAPAELPEPVTLLTSEDTAKKYYEAMADLDTDTLFDLCVDPVSVKNAIESGEYEDVESLRAIFADEFMDEYEDDILALGENRRVSQFDVVSITDVPEDEYKGEFSFIFAEGDASIDAKGIDSVVVVCASITLEGDEDKVSVEECNTPLIKVDGKWYIGTYLMSVTAGKSDPPTTYVD